MLVIDVPVAFPFLLLYVDSASSHDMTSVLGRMISDSGERVVSSEKPALQADNMMWLSMHSANSHVLLAMFDNVF